MIKEQLSNKSMYTAPEIELVEIRIEQCIASPTGENFGNPEEYGGF